MSFQMTVMGLWGRFRTSHPERFSRGFQDQLGRCARAFEKAGGEAVPRIRVHDLRHTYATILIVGGKPLKMVADSGSTLMSCPVISERPPTGA
jgi:hypothetical protein